MLADYWQRMWYLFWRTYLGFCRFLANFLSAGLSLRSYETGSEITQLDIALFARESKDPWKLGEYYILSSEQNFSSLKRRIITKNQIKAR